MNLDDIQTEKELLLAKEKVKHIRKKIRENNKPKTITICGNTHNKIKRFCSTLNINIGEWCEKVMLKEIEENNCLIEIDDTEQIEKDSTIIKEKFIEEELKNRFLIKSDKLIFSKSLNFKGYSTIDSLPIYEFLGEDIIYFKMINNFDELDIKFDKVESYELNKNIKTSKDLKDFIILIS